ncbi:MAG TPA: serine/threonine-protein kinase [Kofleriaceae bacterium]|nr:serine/threonine-protein kinase [Kofleriaceae bacterium]
MRDLVDELLHAKVKAKLFGGEHAPKLGRLVLVDRIGAGAMGTVFAAYDPRLERKVAVKVLRSSEEAARVLGEARALAKLAHPNVVTIYDADELDGLVYIVMELAPGVSLRTWIGAHRDWRDIVRVMREAGAGIAAAHAAGLVHRDIKPDNILVGDDRTRVVDFGLAAPRADTEGESAGTPFYMAPEVLDGGAATEASDQFSFGVTLYEALYGRRPHGPLAPTASGEAATIPASMATKTHRDLIANLREVATQASTARPPSSSVPAWLHAIVARALAPRPAGRFASMSELVTALGRDRRRSRTIVLGATALAMSGILGAAIYRTQSRGESCTGGPARSETVWNDTQRTKVRDALGKTRWAPQTVAALDARAEQWQLSYRRVCEATRHGEQSDALLDLRMRCLDRVLDHFGALTGALAGSALEPSARVAAPGAIDELPSIEDCERLSDPAELALPTDRKQREQVTAVEHDLARASAAFALGRYNEARGIVGEADGKLAGITAPRVRAESLLLSSSIEARIGDGAVARSKLDEALVAAADAKAPELELDVWSRRLRNELFAGDPAKVIEQAPFARAAAKRANRQGADIDGVVAQALRNAGQLGEARELLDRALASTDPLRENQRSLLEMNRGSIELAVGNSAGALTLFQRAYDRVLSALGDNHPELAIYIDKLAAAKRSRGKLREALQLHDRSIELRIAAFGTEDRAVATGLLYRAQTKLEAGDIEGARRDLDDARAIRQKTFGATSPRVGEIVAAQGELASAAGNQERALILYDEAIKLDPRLELAARRFAAGGTVDLDAIAPLGPGELLSIERAGALAARIALLQNANRADEARALAATLRARYKPGEDPALASALASAQLAAGDRTAAADILAKTAAALGNEPTRTALHVFTQLAHASDTQAQAAARAAIALYQAMPALDRAEHDEMWAISRR